jgi:hypothetical protein
MRKGNGLRPPGQGSRGTLCKAAAFFLRRSSKSSAQMIMSQTQTKNEKNVLFAMHEVSMMENETHRELA